MLLAIDVGNTNTVFALYKEADLIAEWRIATDGRRTADEYFVWLNHLMAQKSLRPEDVSGAVLATVAPQTLFNLKTLSRRYYEADPLVVGEAGVDVGIAVRYPNPAEIGADRLVNARAAVTAYGPALVVIDFGTATTFDVVDSDGAYIGGVISPGINLSIAALQAAAAKLPNIGIARPETVIGTDTVGAMQSGVYWGYIGLIEGLCARIAAELGHEITVIATGGLSPLFAAGTRVIDHVDDMLTMRGLVEIHTINRGAIAPGV